MNKIAKHTTFGLPELDCNKKKWGHLKDSPRSKEGHLNRLPMEV